MLNDTKVLLEKNDWLTEDELIAASARLHSRQFLYYQNSEDRAAYKLITKFQSYYETLFAATGWTLYYDPNAAFVGIVPDDGEGYLQLKKDESILLLIIRLLYEEAVDALTAKQWMVSVTGEEMLIAYDNIVRDGRPKQGRIREIFALFRRHGILRREGNDDSSETRYQIMPAIRILAGEAYLKKLDLFRTSSSDETSEPQTETEEELELTSEADGSTDEEEQA